MVLVIPTTFIICTVSRGKSKKYHQHSEQLASSQRDAVITILFITLIFFLQSLDRENCLCILFFNKVKGPGLFKRCARAVLKVSHRQY